MSLIKPINIYIILVGVQVIRLSVGWRKKNACRADVTCMVISDTRDIEQR